jgi:hypothetical protein
MKIAIWFFGILSLIECFIIIALGSIIKDYEEEENRRDYMDSQHYD